MKPCPRCGKRGYGCRLLIAGEPVEWHPCSCFGSEVGTIDGETQPVMVSTSSLRPPAEPEGMTLLLASLCSTEELEAAQHSRSALEALAMKVGRVVPPSLWRP